MPGPLLRAGLLLVLAAVATEGASRFVGTLLAEAPRARDTVLHALPYLLEARYVTTAAMAAGVLLFVWYAVRIAPDEAADAVAVVALMYLLRAILMVLTPLASPRAEDVWMLPVFTHGMFPSGHTAVALLFASLTDVDRAPRLRRVQQALAATVVVTLLLSRGHYSIDIAGGALLAYFVRREWTDGRAFAAVRRLVGVDRIH